MTLNLTNKFLLMLGLGLGGNALAHETNLGPHGGKVVDFGDKHHLEGVLEGNTAHFYLLDGDNKSAAIDKHSGGSITIMIPGKGASKTNIPSTSPFSQVSAPVAGKGKITANIKLNVGGRVQSATIKFDKK